MPYLQKYLTNFKKLLFAERWGRWLLWLKIWSAPTFWFCNSHSTIFPTSRKCKNFTISLYTVLAKMPYLQKYLTNLQKPSLWLKDEERGYCARKFEIHRHFRFAIATLQLFQHPEHVKNSTFPLHCASQQKCYIFKSI